MEREIPYFELPRYEDIYKATEASPPYESTYILGQHQTIDGIGTSDLLPGANFALGFKGLDGSVNEFRLSTRVSHKFDGPRGGEYVGRLFFGFAMNRGEEKIVDGIQLVFSRPESLKSFLAGLSGHFNDLAGVINDLDS